MTFDIGENVTAVLLALIAGIPAIIAARYAYKANDKSERALAQTQHTGEAINGRMDELLALTRTASRAEGVVEGRDHPATVNVRLPNGQRKTDS